MKTLLPTFAALLLSVVTSSPSIPLAWDDANPPGVIAYYQVLAGSSPTNMAPIGTNYFRPTDSNPYLMTNIITGQFYLAVRGVTTNGIATVPSNILGLWGPFFITNFRTVPSTNGLQIIGPP